MFKKLKKLYFKIYHLLKLIGVFIIIFGLSKRVYAEECTNLINNQKWLYWNGNYFLVDSENHTEYYQLEPLTKYTIFFDYGEENFEDILNTSTAIERFEVVHKWGTGTTAYGSVDLTKKSYTFETQADMQNNNLSFMFRMIGKQGNTEQTPFINDENHEFWLVKGEEICRTKPTPQENVYSEFLTIYLNKITYLTEGFTNNPYLLAMIGIIFGFIVLEIVLKLLNIRRKK